MRSAVRSPTHPLGTVSLPEALASRWIDVGAAVLWLPLAYSAWTAWQTRQAPLALPLLGMNLLIVCLFVFRRSSRDSTRRLLPWALGLGGTFCPLLMRAGVGPAGPIQEMSLALQVVAISGILLCLLRLGRSFGIVAAHRGLVKDGPYRLVRHPLYTCEIAFYGAVLLGNCTWANALFWGLCTVLQVMRAEEEERLMVRDLRYRDYRRHVPYRFIPGVL
ncbi:MAG: hypothetical protein KGR26_02710 [Cyanobacteria bacterium REEB65]|nr:hypothetical protein [Cyanobacteria bacterium REEB65]